MTFCVDAEGLNDAGICVSRCDYALFSDTGCRPQYECRSLSRYSNPSVVQDVCLPVNWWRNPTRYFDYGVASGEVTHDSAVVWAHTGEIDGDVVVEYGLAEGALGQRAESLTTAATGFAVQVDLTGL